MANNALTPWLEEKVRNGETILFLGAGANHGARGAKGEKPLNGNQLRDTLADRFLGGSLKDKPLAQVAEYAKSESSLTDVQAAIREVFEPLQPAECHLIIPTFRWHAIVTTNYDFIVERAYATATARLQQLDSIIRDGDKLAHTLRNPKALPYLKLHGCLSTINDPTLPLILASEEYAKHRRGRERLFNYFQDWAREYPVIFCGYNIADPNIQQILFDLSELGINRPVYAVVSPDLTDFDVRYWQSRRFLPVKATFEEFLRGIDTRIPRHARIISTLRERDASSIQSWVQKGQPTDQLLLYLDQVLEHVRTGSPFEAVTPRDFYRGEGNSWSPIKQQIDVRRRISDDLLIEAVLDKPNTQKPQIYLVKGHAGSGKSVSLRRFAWDAATEHHALIFWLREGGYLRTDLLRELYVLTGERVFIVIDDAIAHLADIATLFKAAEKDRIPLTFVLAARSNEWNVAGGDLDPHVTRSYELRDLTPKEIDELLVKLEDHDCLGVLRELPQQERQQFFNLSAERQLLVALHEATAGKSFEEIVVDEYRNVVPLEAQILYLDVCTLHRFRVGVRAGLLSRVSGITFNYFRDRLLRPLEHVVHVYHDPSARDYAYRTRHAVIADLVFKRILADQDERAEQIVRIVRSMNVDYESDRTAFEQLIRGRDLAELFSDRILADRIFEAALTAKADVSHIEHQRAVFELNHPGGNLLRSLRAVEKAIESSEAPNQAFMHTKALVLRRMAKESNNALERDKLRSDAKAILARQIKKGIKAHPFHVLGQIILDELEERLSALQIGGPEQGLEDRILSELIASAEKVLEDGLQRFPGESYLLDLEAKLAKFLKDTPRAMIAIEKAFESTPENGYFAVRLAERYLEQGEPDQARSVLAKCIEHNPTSKIAHLHFAKRLMNEDAHANAETIKTHLRASFTEGDTNYDAQFWFARHEFLYGQRGTAEQIFEQLAKAKVSPESRNRARARIEDSSGRQVRYDAFVVSAQDAFCFARIPNLNTDVFIHHSQFNENQWRYVRRDVRVRLSVGFNFKGPVGVDAEVIN